MCIIYVNFNISYNFQEIVKKCEQAVQDHAAYSEKYKQCSEWLSSAQDRFNLCGGSDDAGAAREELANSSEKVKELLTEQPVATALLGTTIELGEKLYPSTSVEGREIIRLQFQELQQLMESLFDAVSSKERELQVKLSRYVYISGYVRNILQFQYNCCTI